MRSHELQAASCNAVCIHARHAREHEHPKALHAHAVHWILTYLSRQAGREDDKQQVIPADVGIQMHNHLTLYIGSPRTRG